MYVYIYVYIYIYICMYTYMYMSIYIYIYVNSTHSYTEKRRGRPDDHPRGGRGQNNDYPQVDMLGAWNKSVDF